MKEKIQGVIKEMKAGWVCCRMFEKWWYNSDIRLLNVCFMTSMVPVDWMSACVKVKVIKYECASFRDISLFSVVSKVYGRALIKWIREGTADVICEN